MCRQPLRVQGDGGIVIWTDSKHYHVSCLVGSAGFWQPARTDDDGAERIARGTDAVMHLTNSQERRESAIGAAKARRRVPRSGNRRTRIRGGLAPWRARQLVTHIDAHLAGRVSVTELAQLTGVSNGHFGRAFKQTFGFAPRTYLRRRRIELAQELMLRTDLTLSQIALRCGLFDQPHLSKMFRSVVGETPSAWRRSRTGCGRGAELRDCSGARDLFAIRH
jgi:AraC-like DNA-binding protein